MILMKLKKEIISKNTVNYNKIKFLFDQIIGFLRNGLSGEVEKEAITDY